MASNNARVSHFLVATTLHNVAPLDIANILKEATQTTTSFGLMEYIQRNGIRTSSQEETLEAARSLRSSALINPVEVMADSEGTATGYFTRDKIAEMFQEPVAEERARRQEWTPEPQVQSPPPPSFPKPQMQAWEQSATVPAPSVEETQPPWEQTTPPQIHPSPQTPSWEQAEPKPWEQPAAVSHTPPPVAPPPPWSQAPPAPQERPTPSLPPPSEKPTVSNPYIQPGAATPGTPTPVPEPPPPPVFSVGQHSTPPPSFQASPPPPVGHSTLQGGIPKQWILIGVGVLLLLIFVIIGSVWWFSQDTPQSVSSEFVKPRTPIEEPAIEPSEPAQEPAQEEVKKVPPQSKPKQKSIPKRNNASSKPKRTPTKAKPKTVVEPKKVTQAATTVGVSSFDVTITFPNEATLQCGDGQSKDFVKQTTITFQTRTVCRITSENDERGALTATKSGTIQCNAAGEKIRCN